MSGVSFSYTRKGWIKSASQFEHLCHHTCVPRAPASCDDVSSLLNIRRTDASQLYSVAEECGACGNAVNRDFLLARRLGSNLRKLGKRTGDVLVVQFRPSQNEVSSLPTSLLTNLKGRRLSELVELLHRSASQEREAIEAERDHVRGSTEVSLDLLIGELRRRRCHSEETEGSNTRMSNLSTLEDLSLPTALGSGKSAEGKILRRKKRLKGKNNCKTKRRPARVDTKFDGSLSSDGEGESPVAVLSLSAASLLSFLRRILRTGLLPEKWKVDKLQTRSKRSFLALHTELVTVALEITSTVVSVSTTALHLLQIIFQNFEEGSLATVPERVCCNELEHFHSLLPEKTFAVSVLGAVLVTCLTDTPHHTKALNQLVAEEGPVMPMLLLVCLHWTLREVIRNSELEALEVEKIMESLFKLSGRSSVAKSSTLRRSLRFVYRVLGPLHAEVDDKPDLDEVEHVCHVNSVRRCQSVSIDIVYGDKSSLLDESEDADSEEVELRSLGSSTETKDAKQSLGKDDDWTPSTATPNNKLRLRVYRRHQARKRHNSYSFSLSLSADRHLTFLHYASTSVLFFSPRVISAILYPSAASTLFD